MEIVVFGAGSLGSLVGGMLARAHQVILVGRNPHMDAVRETGLTVGGAFDFTVRPGVTTDGTDLSGDVAVVTVKSFDTPAAARDLATGEFDAVLSLSNGMGNEAQLAERVSCPVLAGTATYGAVNDRPGHVTCTGEGEVVLGARDGGPSPVAEKVGQIFEEGGVETTVAEDMPRRLWEKLAVNAGINAVTALARTENGAILGGEANDVARRAARETARLARARGVDLDGETAVEALESVATKTADNTSSMHQDVAANRRTEVDAINGYVADQADSEEVETPTNWTLAGLLRAWERDRDLR